MKIAVVDGLGGGLGCQIIENLKKELENPVKIIALGTNSGATANMLNKGADRGATGENAIKVTARQVDIVTGPLGIIIPNSMLGEITAAMAEAIVDCPAKKFLLGINQPHFELIGMKEQSINNLVTEMVGKLKLFIRDNS